MTSKELIKELLDLDTDLKVKIKFGDHYQEINFADEVHLTYENEFFIELGLSNDE